MTKVSCDRFRKKDKKNLCSKADNYIQARVVIRVDGLKWSGGWYKIIQSLILGSVAE